MSISKNLGYILGVLVGDGWLNKNSVGLNAKDNDFVLAFKKALEDEFKLNAKIHFYNGLWRVELHSRQIVKLLKNLDYRLIVNEHSEVKCSFLKGFYDSEGSAYYQEKTGVRNRKIELYNTDLELLTICKNLLEELGIKTREIDKRFRDIRLLKGRTLPITICCRITLRENKENFIRFRNLIGFSIKRKIDILDKLIDSYLMYRSKWKNLREEVLKLHSQKSYSELRKQFKFIPKGTIDRWIYGY